MPGYKSFIVDAFTSTPFAGNPAAVCLISEHLPFKKYQKIAAEFNLAATAFPVPLNGEGFEKANRFQLRWFTPKVQIDLCGHATLAASHVLFNEIGNVNDAVTFETMSGELTVRRDTNKSSQVMNFPQYKKWISYESSLQAPNSSYNFGCLTEKAPDYINDFVKVRFFTQLTALYCICLDTGTKLNVRECYLLYRIEERPYGLPDTTTLVEFQSIKSNMDKLLKAHDGSAVKGIIVTIAPKDAAKQGFVDANGRPYDYVSRYFATWLGVAEDPATGSAQSVLAPFWAKVKGSNGPFYAYQYYPSRGGLFNVKMPSADRIDIVGQAVTVLRGELNV